MTKETVANPDTRVTLVGFPVWAVADDVPGTPVTVGGAMSLTQARGA